MTVAAEAVITIKGAKGSLSLPLGEGVSVVQEDKRLQVKFTGDDAVRIRAGATRAHLANMVSGVTKGYERKLELVGVGFRAAVQGKTLNLTLGFSHPVDYRDSGGHHHRDAEPDRDPHQGHRPAEGRSDGGRDPRHPPARALQGQGCALRGEKITLKEGQEEVMSQRSPRRSAATAPRSQDPRARSASSGVARLTVHRTPRHIYAQLFDARRRQGAGARLHRAEGRRARV